jgi:hypothetical protein
MVELTPADLSAGPAALGRAAVDTWLAATGEHAGPGLSLTPVTARTGSPSPAR